MYKGEIPFSGKTGNQLGYPQDYTYVDGVWSDCVEWRNNFSFMASLRIIDYSRGRSSVKIILADEVGIEYEMFITDLMKLINLGIGPGGSTATIQWTFRKRGANYGITPLVDV